MLKTHLQYVKMAACCPATNVTVHNTSLTSTVVCQSVYMAVRPTASAVSARLHGAVITVKTVRFCIENTFQKANTSTKRKHSVKIVL